MTDVSAGFRPPCWCPCTWAPAWRLHTNLYKFGENVSSHIFHEKNCCDLNLGESLCICTFFLFPDSGLNLLNGFDFLFWSILNGVTLKTSNCERLKTRGRRPTHYHPLLTKEQQLTSIVHKILPKQTADSLSPKVSGSFCRYRSTDYVSLRKTKEIKDRKQNNSK